MRAAIRYVKLRREERAVIHFNWFEELKERVPVP